MALRNLRPTPETPTEPASAAEVQPTAPTPQATYIDAGCELVGKLSFKETVRIDGRVEGEIEGARSVIVGEAAVIQAGIRAESVEVHGNIEGDISVDRKVTLHKTARVNGEIRTAGIVVEEGARFKGCIVIGEDAPAAHPHPGPSSGSPDSY